jgi:micrococcal nuclease
VLASILGTAAGCDNGGAPSSAPSSASRPATPAQTPPRATVTQAGSPTIPDGEDAVVASVTDGDTIRVRVAGGPSEPVRLTGIDTPETKDPRTVVECFGAEAAAQTSALLPPGTAVRLERDVDLHDRYGRRLAYVWRTSDALFVNAALVRDGFAAPYRYPPNVKYADLFSALGRQAREAGVGLWGACGGPNTPASGSTVVTAPPSPTSPASTGACDPNYSGACVPITSQDLDCADIGVHDFRVVGDDPHHFDGNHDGIACQ